MSSCSTGFLVLETEAQGVFSESWIPCVPGEETTDRNYLDMLSSTGQQLPRLPLGAIAISQQECEVIQSIQKRFVSFVSRSGEWQRHLSFIQCYYLSCSNLRVNWLLGYEPNPKAAEKFHNCKPSPSLGFQVKPTRMIFQLKK